LYVLWFKSKHTSCIYLILKWKSTCFIL